MIFNAASRAQVREAEPLWMGKFVLRVLCFVSSIIALCVAGYSYSVDLSIIWLVIPLSASIVWNAANMIVRFSRARPMHPGANVGMDLVIWLAFLVGLIFSFAAGIILIAASSDSYYYRGRSYCRSYSYYSSSSYSSDNCEDVLRQQGTVDIVACVFGVISMIFHFVLFVWACVDTNRRNRADSQRAAMMLTQGMAHHQSMGPPPHGGGFPPGGYTAQGGYPYGGGAYQPQQMQQPGYQAYAPHAEPAPPGIGPAYAQHASYYDKGPHSATHEQHGASRAPPTEATQSPALSSVSPIEHTQQQQPEVAPHQPKTY